MFFLVNRMSVMKLKGTLESKEMQLEIHVFLLWKGGRMSSFPGCLLYKVTT